MQHAVVGSEKYHSFGAVVGILVVKYERLAVQNVTGNNRSVFRAIPVRILIQHVGTTDVFDDFFSSANGSAVYRNIGRIAKNHGGQMVVVVNGKPVHWIGKIVNVSQIRINMTIAVMDSVAFGNIGPVDRLPVRLGFFAHGTVGPRCRISVAANDFTRRAEPEFGHIAFPEIFVQRFKKGHIDFIAAGGTGNRNHRSGKRAGPRDNAVDCIHDCLGKPICGLSIKMIFAVFRIRTVG